MSQRVRTHRDLIAWQRGMALTKQVYINTRSMPESERWGLVDQMRRAAVSVPSNIAEGFGNQTRGLYLRFLRIARGSLAELNTQIEIAVMLKMMPDPNGLLELAAETDRVLQGLIRALEDKP